MHSIGEGIFAELDRVKRERDEARAEIVKLEGALAFAASCIKSGEARARTDALEDALKTHICGDCGWSYPVEPVYDCACCHDIRAALLPEKTEGK